MTAPIATSAASGASLRVAFIGDESLAAQCAEIARQAGLEVVVLATQHAQVRQYAHDNGIACVDSGGEVATTLGEHRFDVLLSVANLRVLPQAVLDQARLNINFHDGPLPGYGGLNVTTWAILNGESEHAVTWHVMTADVDGGDVIASETFAIYADDTAFSLNARCYEAALRSFPRVAEALASGSVPTQPQPSGTRRMFGKFQRPAALFDPQTPAAEVEQTVRSIAVGHRLRNTLGVVRLLVGDDVCVVEGCAAQAATPGTTPGQIVSIDEDGVRVATVDGDLVLTELATPAGATIDARATLRSRGIGVGSMLAAPPTDLIDALAEFDGALARGETFWLGRLTSTELSDVPRLSTTAADVGWSTVPIALPANVDDTTVVAAIGAWLARIAGTALAAVGYRDAATRAIETRLSPLVHPPIARLDVAPDTTFAALVDATAAERATLQKRGPFLRDLIGRDPRTRDHPPAPPVVVELDADSASRSDDGAIVRFVISPSASRVDLHHRLDAIDAGQAARLAAQIATLLSAGFAAPTTLVSRLPLVSVAEHAALDALNRTDLDYERNATVDALFRAQVARTPGAPALSFGSRTLSYTELAAAADTLATALRGVGVGRGDRVGIALPRGIDMLVSVLAVLDCGAAYVPLDPTYPEDRLGFMVDDSGIKALIAEGEMAVKLARPHLALVRPDNAPVTMPGRAAHVHDATDLAYVIYTSGSTGRPKGVMLEHRNAVNFFAAMDNVIEHDDPGVWLSVTSLSFDISVLELLWTLTRGFHVVLKADRGIPVNGAGEAPVRPVSFSLFYFAAGEAEASDGYRLLLEGAQFADRNGFEAVWTPERHFHAFGGFYPNPSVVSAALATATKNVKIRGGSVVLPLHSPVRVAEEWAVVDNLSRGRVAISFAAGWQPNDFVLNPAVYGRAKEELPGLIDVVKRLWRGESVEMPGHDGNPVTVRTLPRPVQPELPVWLTSAGTPATFEQAGRLGTGVLTHLLGQSLDDLAANIARYRKAWADAGHPGDGHVTLMLHTFLDRDAHAAKQSAREPLKGYLGTAVSLLRNMASAFPTFANSGKDADEAFKSLSADEISQLLDMAVARYLDTSGLFGTPQDAAEMVERVSVLGVDEVACLIDFGVETQNVIDSFDLLLEAKALVDQRRAAPGAARSTAEAIAVEDDTVAALGAKHAVTHLQCTPSLAAMLVADPADRQALSKIRHLMVGGEALPTALAGELRRLLPDRFTNMYGPTETTIWSLTHEIATVPEGGVPIGRPIANTTIFVLDANGELLPTGVFGELHIGGDGVARGYHARADLTAERFVDRAGIGRVYATGDVARIHPDGYVEFAGRADNQVKIRGHRIELGEIEAVLDAHPDVVQSVVVARSDNGSPQLVAYLVTHGNRPADGDIMRKHVAETLPEIMVPAAILTLDALPLTPNGKVDRKMLPAPPLGAAVVAAEAQLVPPADDRERMVATIWSEELGRPVGRDDNFFEIGGHSLLAVKVFRRLSDATTVPLALTDVFRYPTVRAFAVHLAASDGSAAAAATPTASAPSGTDRGAMRRRALNRRGGQD